MIHRRPGGGRFVWFLALLMSGVGAFAEPVRADSAAPQQRERLRQLGEKLEWGTLSADETKELLLGLIGQTVGADAAAPPNPSPPQAPGAVGKLIAVYRERNSTKLVIETRRPLVIGNNVFAGPGEVEVTLGDLLSRSGEVHYYSASFPGRTDLKTGDEVFTQKTQTLRTPNPLVLKFRESYTFAQKHRGEVTAVQEGKAMIDRGTLHEVRERDLYRVYSASGDYKGLLEIRGIGDLQSSGELYNRFEDRRKNALTTAPGDRVVFIGQRKLFALGLVGGASTDPGHVLGKEEVSQGGGLAWDIMFQDGWGFEVLFGAYARGVASQAKRFLPLGGGTLIEQVDWNVMYIAPMMVKKNFFFPAVVSPYLAAGGSLCSASLKYARDYRAGPVNELSDDTDSRVTFAPVLGAGVEFFPARFLRPRIEARWFGGPTLGAGVEKLNTAALYVSAGFFTAW